MLNGTIDLSTAATAVRIGSSNLIERKWLYIYNASGVPIFIGSEYLDANGNPTTITAYLLGKIGQKLASGDAIWLPVSDRITVYARANTGAGKRIRVMEIA